MWPILIRRVKWEAFELPESTQVVHLKQYWITCGQKEINTFIKDMLETEVLVPTNFLYKCPMWPITKAGGSWRSQIFKA